MRHVTPDSPLSSFIIQNPIIYICYLLLHHLLNTKIVDKMESQLQQTHGAHGRHYDQDPLTGQDHNEDEHHGEKKSVMKKVKEKAKKIKNTITKHGHGHHHHDEEEDDDDDDETVEDPEVHGAPSMSSSCLILYLTSLLDTRFFSFTALFLVFGWLLT
ncbi:hypothetical protein Hdeb2414_s1037g00975751 [Helianthus debilis subsp. tardiflorus]